MQVRTSKSWWRRLAAAGIAAHWSLQSPGRRRLRRRKPSCWSTPRWKPTRSRRTKRRSTRPYPDVAIKWVRDSTGVITAKLLAEKANPQADLVVGVSASSMAVFANDGMLQGYAPKGLDKIVPAYRDPKNPPEWVGMDVYGAAICFNTVEAAKLNLPKPDDLEGPDQARLQGQDRHAQPCVVGHRLPRRRRLAADVGRDRRLQVHGRACTRTSPTTRIRDRSRAARRVPANSRSASRSSIAR